MNPASTLGMLSSLVRSDSKLKEIEDLEKLLDELDRQQRLLELHGYWFGSWRGEIGWFTPEYELVTSPYKHMCKRHPEIDRVYRPELENNK